MERDSLDMIPSLRDETPTLRFDRRLLERPRSLSGAIPSLASARQVRMYDPDTVVLDLDDYAEITLA